MWAILAFAAFVVALLLNLAHAGQWTADLTLAGLALLALHLAWPVVPWNRPGS